MYTATSLRLTFILQAVAICVSAQDESNYTWYAFVGETVNLSCEFGESYKPLMTTWRHNGTVIAPQDSSVQRSYSSVFDIADSKAWLEIQDVGYSDAGLYTCKLIHSNVGSEASWKLHVLVGQVFPTNTRYALVEQIVNLSCEFGAPYPPSVITWIHNGAVIIPQKNSLVQARYSSVFDNSTSKAWLTIQDVTFSDAGFYTCKLIHEDVGSKTSWTLHLSDSRNTETSSMSNFEVTTLSPTTATEATREHDFSRELARPDFRWLVIILIFVFATLFTGIAFLVKWLLGKFGRRGQYDNICQRTLPSVPTTFTRKESVDADIYNDITEVNECKEMKEMKYMKGDRTLLRENKQTEKIREEAIVFEMQLKSDSTKQTWYGTFERKRKGKVPVLISTAPETVDLRLHTQWYRHASSIVKLPASNNIVTTLGLCIKSENVFLVQEYLPNGTLRDNLSSFEVPAPTESISEATLHTFVSYTMDITSGLDFLSAHGWVHPGLTAAKVLLSFDKTCKLYDFCSLGDATVKLQSIIRKKGKERAMQLPPESFDLTDYTSRSDIWALGVVMWEIFSCGSEPELPKGAFSVRESSLGQLLKPEFCPTIVYRAITLCWARDPWSRPSFQDLKEYLNCAIEIHQLAKGTNKSRSDRPSEDSVEHFLNDISYDKDMTTADVRDTCL